ncbi:MAG: ExbD/TolR family protein [Planctomycetota bacterium]|jgi:biopolymer transport protein ExbD
MIFHRGSADIEANLTPMIDVTFLLIVFFVLVSQIVEVENVALTLPEPIDPLTQRQGDEQRTVINIVPESGGGVQGYRMGKRLYPAGERGLASLTAQLATLFAANPQTGVNLRADRGTHYEHVEPVLQAISVAAGQVDEVEIAARVNLVVVREQ